MDGGCVVRGKTVLGAVVVGEGGWTEGGEEGWMMKWCSLACAEGENPACDAVVRLDWIGVPLFAYSPIRAAIPNKTFDILSSLNLHPEKRCKR